MQKARSKNMNSTAIHFHRALEFQLEAALYWNDLWVHDSLHFGRWSFSFTIERVVLDDTSERRVNIALIAVGHVLADSALRT